MLDFFLKFRHGRFPPNPPKFKFSPNFCEKNFFSSIMGGDFFTKISGSVISEHIRFLLFSFSVLHVLVVGSVR